MDLECKICKNESKLLFTAKVLKKYNVSYFQCTNCDFVQTETPFWLDEAYSSALGAEDTGVLKRNNYIANIASFLISLYFNKKGVFLDYAGGYGIFTRLMRDKGFDFYWVDPYAENLVARGFEWNSVKKADLVTSLEAFEHFEDPNKQIDEILKISKNVLFTTQLFPKSVSKPNDWWYFSLDGGQHIAFHTFKSLSIIAKRNQLNFYSNGKSVHLFTEKKLNPFIFNLLIKVAGTKLNSVLQFNPESKTESDMKMILLK